MSFYLMHRGWMDDPVFKDEPFTEREAFLWMIENAVWEAEGRKKKLSTGGKVIVLERGSLCYSKRFMAKKWGWNLPKVQRYTRRLEIDTLIDTANDTGETIITIRNYEKYQRPLTISDTPTDTQSETQMIHQPIQRITTKQLKQLISPYPLFEKFFERFPRQRRGSKRKASLAWNAALLRATDQEILNGLESYIASRSVREGFAKGAAAWLNDDGWTYEEKKPEILFTAKPLQTYQNVRIV